MGVEDEGRGGAGAAVAGGAILSLAYATQDELSEAYRGELVHGAVFVATTQTVETGRRVSVTLELLFCDGRIDLEGEVVASLPAGIARAGATPGVSVQLAIPGPELRRKLEEITGFELRTVASELTIDQRRAPRFPARASAILEVAGRHFTAETVDISYEGMLALLPGIDLVEGTETTVWLQHPGTGDKLDLPGRVMNQTRCDHGVMALGVQFFYGVERIDDVSVFIDDLRAYHHARSLASVSGSLADTPLENVLETFAAVSSAGTLVLKRAQDHGKVAYREGEILYATTGLVSGTKALGRMFAWTDAVFEFRPIVEPVDIAQTLLPLQSAIVAAAIERDEVAHLDLGNLHAETTFILDQGKLDAVAGSLDDLSSELAENAGMSFPLGALLDILAAGDASIYKALVDLIEAGVIRVESA